MMDPSNIYQVTGEDRTFVVPLISHETIRRRRRSLLGSSAEVEPDRPPFSRHDPRFLKLPPEAQIAGLYQGYGTVRLEIDTFRVV